MLNIILLFLKQIILRFLYPSLCGKIELDSCMVLEKPAILMSIVMNYTRAISLNYQDRDKLGR